MITATKYVSDPKSSVPNILPRILPAVKKVLPLSYRNSLNNVLVTTWETSKTSNIQIAMCYQNIYGNSKTLICHQLLSRVLLQKCYQKQLNLCKLCLSEKFYIGKSFNDPNLLLKKSQLVNASCHQSKLLLKCFIRNQYRERSNTMAWDLVLILVILYSMCQYVAILLAWY